MCPDGRETTAFDTGDAERLALELYGLEARARPLPGYADANFHLSVDAVGEFVLKIARGSEDAAALEGQSAVLEHLSARGVRVPSVRRTHDGRALSRIRSASGSEHALRLLSYLPGEPWVRAGPHAPRAFGELGTELGRMDRALADFDHPGLRRRLHWDLLHALDVRTHLSSVPDGSRRQLVTSALASFEERTLPRLRAARRQVIHNDVNDYNILVDPRAADGRVGFIDFGDAVHSALVCDPAIALAYAMLDCERPLEVAQAFLSGYCATQALSADEVELLPDLIRTRLCVSVTYSAYESRRDPSNAYLTVTEGPAWALLERLQEHDAGAWAEALGDAASGAGA